jgi:hypothetical protein
MRKVLDGIRLLIDTDKIVGQHFIQNRNRGEEGKIVERLREKVCARQRMEEKRR